MNYIRIYAAGYEDDEFRMESLSLSPIPGSEQCLFANIEIDDIIDIAEPFRGTIEWFPYYGTYHTFNDYGEECTEVYEYGQLISSKVLKDDSR